MALIETEGVVLKTYNLAEADRIIVLFTRQAGLVRGVAHGARRLKSKFSGSLEPFTSISVTFSEKEGRDLVNLKNTDIRQSLFGMSHRAELLSSIAYMANLLVQFAPPHEPNETLYRMVTAVIDALASRDGDLDGVTRYFEVWLLKLSGFLPDVRRCGLCGTAAKEKSHMFQDLELRFLCETCSGGRGLRVPVKALTLASEVLRLRPLDFALYFCEVGREGRDELAALTRRILDRILESDSSGMRAASY
jgi:DNA repair protein RecO (recombination protein O)